MEYLYLVIFSDGECVQMGGLPDEMIMKNRSRGRSFQIVSKHNGTKEFSVLDQAEWEMKPVRKENWEERYVRTQGRY